MQAVRLMICLVVSTSLLLMLSSCGRDKPDKLAGTWVSFGNTPHTVEITPHGQSYTSDGSGQRYEVKTTDERGQETTQYGQAASPDLMVVGRQEKHYRVDDHGYLVIETCGWNGCTLYVRGREKLSRR